MEKNDKTLLFDITCLKGNISGIERYVSELSKIFIGDTNVYFLITNKTDISLVGNISNLIKVSSVKKKIFDFLTMILPLNLSYLINKNFDYYLFPNFKSYKVTGRSLTVIHDLTYKEKGKLNKINKLKLYRKIKYSINKSYKILTVSKSIKNEILNEFDINVDRVVVVSPGVSNNFINNSTKIIDNNYLFIGTINTRKNIIYLVDTFKKLGPGYNLTICGRKGDAYDLISEKSREQKNIRIITDVNDTELKALYEKNSILLSSSVYEGFGIQVPEGSLMKLIPILSNIEAHLEVAPPNATFFSINEQDSLYKILVEGNFRQMTDFEFEKYKNKFTWVASSRKIIEIVNAQMDSL